MKLILLHLFLLSCLVSRAQDCIYNIEDIQPGIPSSDVSHLTVAGNKLVFAAGDLDGYEIWCYDGFSTYQIMDINPGPQSSITSISGEWGSYHDEVYFKADNGIDGPELWKTDGVTAQMIDINPGPDGSYPDYFIIYNDTLYFQANGGFGIQLWKYDGTNASQVYNNVNGLIDPKGFCVYDSLLIFQANTSASGNELWQFDGNTMVMLLDIYPGYLSSNPKFLTVYEDTLYFQADNGTNGNELWKYNGDTVTLALDINPGVNNSVPSDLVVMDGYLYFHGYSPGIGEELWKYDGIINTPIQIDPSPSSSDPEELTVLNGNLLLFTADDGITGRELWRYDGINLSQVVDLYSGPTSSYPINLFADDKLYLSAHDPSSFTGHELWVTDGYTMNVVDVNPGSFPSWPKRFCAFASGVYFCAGISSIGNELFAYGGVDPANNILVESCGSATVNGVTFDSVGFYTYAGVVPSVSQPCCDSGVVYFVSIKPDFNLLADTVMICPGDSALIFNEYQSLSGLYIDSLQTVSGCDSIISIYLEENSIYSFSPDSLVICQGDSIQIFGNYEVIEGDYYDTLISQYGCDSILFTYLEVSDSSILFLSVTDSIVCENSSSILLTGQPIGGSYTGIGVYNNSFFPDSAGIGLHTINYTYTNDNNCQSQTSLSISVINCIGIEEQEHIPINIFPNPMTDYSVLQFGQTYLGDGYLIIYDLNSKVVFNQRNLFGNSIIIKKGALSPGQYYLKTGFDKSKTSPLVKLIIN